MCGETKSRAGAPDEDCCQNANDEDCCQNANGEDCCQNAYDEDENTSRSEPNLPDNEPRTRTPARNSKGVECVCFYVPIAGVDAQQYNGTQKYAQVPSPKSNRYPGPAPRRPSVPPASGNPWDICDRPPHENFAIPYPRPAPSVELRGGQIYSGCQCVKRDGLQHDCPRTGCQGKAHCMAYPAPMCVPSGNAPPEPPSEATKQREKWPRGGRNQATPLQRGAGGGYHLPDDDDPYVRMGRRGYKENPPVKRRPRVPCEEHRKTRC